MTPKHRIVFFILFILVTISTTAQETNPVQFSFSGNRNADGSASMTIKAIVQPGAKLFSAIMKTPEDVFVSTVNFDTSAKKILAGPLAEYGQVNELQDSALGATVRYFTDSVTWTQNLGIAANDSAVIAGNIVWLAQVGDEYKNGEEKFFVEIPVAPEEGGTEKSQSDSIWSIFWICLGTGILAVFTPCVFPLVPVTVSFFLKRSKTRPEGVRNAVWYSLSIILIYTIPTLVLVLIFGDKILYQISTSPISNLLFFVIFLVFAISFLGAFEITLPSRWANATDEKASKGGFVGIFFMALTLVIVSFSCTGPIVGTLLGQTSVQGVSSAPILGMLGFGVGLALPFSLFAFFPSMLKSLPRSGGWLNTVKVTFGFIELALAMKFLSNVDLAYHWRLLDRDIFLVIWIIIFTLLGFYLLGKLKFSHDSDLQHISVPRLFFAMASFCFALYMFPGLWGAPLKGIGGWLPHTSTQDFNLEQIKYDVQQLKGGAAVHSGTSKAEPPKKYTDILHAPFGLTSYFDLEEGVQAAKALDKPIMLDFTGHSCANCRKMEAEVWSDPEVLEILRNDFVLVSLYVDESTPLKPAEQFNGIDGDRITTVGGKNLEYEKSKFQDNAQPLYMFLDLQQVPLSNEHVGYVSKEKFLAHLQKVKEEFAKRAK